MSSGPVRLFFCPWSFLLARKASLAARHRPLAYRRAFAARLTKPLPKPVGNKAKVLSPKKHSVWSGSFVSLAASRPCTSRLFIWKGSWLVMEFTRLLRLIQNVFYRRLASWRSEILGENLSGSASAQQRHCYFCPERKHTARQLHTMPYVLTAVAFSPRPTVQLALEATLRLSLLPVTSSVTRCLLPTSASPSASRELLEIRISSAAKKKERKKEKTITTGKIQEEALWGGRNIQRKWKVAEQKCFHISPCASEREPLLCSLRSCTRVKSVRLVLLRCYDSSSIIKGCHVGAVALEIWRSLFGPERTLTLRPLNSPWLIHHRRGRDWRWNFGIQHSLKMPDDQKKKGSDVEEENLRSCREALSWRELAL